MSRTQKRRLADLYVVGKDVEFDDGAGDPISVYVRKLNTGEHEKAVRRANAERSKILALKRHPEGEEYQNQWAVVEQFSRHDLEEYLIEDEKQHRTEPLEAEVAAEEEWSNEEYLKGLQDSWAELSDDPENPDYEQVKQEIDRFEAQVKKALDDHLDGFRADLADTDETVLQQRVFEKLLDVQGSLAWLSEFRACEIWLSVREADKRTHYFEARTDIDELPTEVLASLQDAYRSIAVEAREGNSSRQTDTSSTSSEPAANTEMVDSSGPEVVTA